MEGTTMDVDPNDSNETANIKNNVGIENKIESPHMKKDIANNDHTNTKAPISSIEKGDNGIISASNNSNNVKIYVSLDLLSYEANITLYACRMNVMFVLNVENNIKYIFV